MVDGGPSSKLSHEGSADAQAEVSWKFLDWLPGFPEAAITQFSECASNAVQWSVLENIGTFWGLGSLLQGAGDLVSISRVISALNGVTLIITLLITNLLSPLPLQVGFGLKVEKLGLLG